MDHIMTYEEYLRDVKKGIVTDLGNSPVTPLLLMLQGKWKTQILYELCIHDTVSAVLYRCEATEVNIPYHYDDGNVHMNHVIRLKKLDQYNPSFLPFEAESRWDWCGTWATKNASQSDLRTGKESV